MTKEKNNIIYILKCFAIISVICAHCNSIPNDSIYVIKCFSCILSNWGTYGVGLFFIVSGYLFNPEKDRYSFFKKKLINICIPWLTSSVLVYLYVHLRSMDLSIIGFIQFLFGFNSYLYYLSVIMLLYIIYYFIPLLRRVFALIIAIVINLVFVLGTIKVPYISEYINIANWIGYFALGVLIKSHLEIFGKIKTIIYNNKVLFAILHVCILITKVLYLSRGSYWGCFNAIQMWSGMTLLYILAMASSNGSLFTIIGKYSFTIYLWHIPFAGMTAKLMSKGILIYFVLIRPVIVLVVTLFLLKTIEIIMNKMRFHKLMVVIGLPRD